MAIFTKADYSRGVALRSRTTREPLPIDGWALEMVVRATRDAAEALVTLTTANAGLVLDNSAPGRFEIRLTVEQTNAIGAGDRVFAIYRTDGGHRDRIMSGRMIVKAGV